MEAYQSGLELVANLLVMELCSGHNTYESCDKIETCVWVASGKPYTTHQYNILNTTYSTQHTQYKPLNTRHLMVDEMKR